MKIVGTDGMTDAQIRQEIDRGARFILYQYCVSLIVVTMRRSSDIRFVRAGEASIAPGLGYSAISFLLGWWGIPWGPIYTVQSLWTNFRGGRDVTREILANAARAAASRIPQAPG